VIGQQPTRAAALAPTPIPWSTNAAGSAPARSWPPADWPSTAQLDYTQKLVTVVLLLLALPWVLGKFARSPRAAGETMAGKVLP
jgi:hypothetical protein